MESIKKAENSDFDYSELLEDDLELLDLDNKISTEEVDYTSIDVKHWLLDTKVLKDKLSPLQNILIRSGNIKDKSVFIQKENNDLLFMFNVNQIEGIIRIPLLNTDNQCEEEFTIDYFKFMIAVNNSESKVLIKNNKPSEMVIEVYKGDIEFDNYRLNKSMFINEDKVEKEQNINTSTFLQFIKNVISTEKLAQRPVEKMVRVESDKAYSYYALSVVRYFNLDFSDISFRLLDLNFILKIFNNHILDKDILLKHTDKNFVLELDGILVKVPKVRTNNLETLKNIFNNMSVVSEFEIDTLMFFKKLNLIKSLNSSDTKLNIFVENNNLKVTGKTKTNKEFNYILSENVPTNTKINTILPVDVILKSYGSFKLNTKITIKSLSNNKFSLSNADLEITFGGLI